MDHECTFGFRDMLPELINFVVLPIGLGLLGFIEPCSMGTNLLFIKSIENRAPIAKLKATAVFSLARGIVIGMLGWVAALVGIAFVGFQKGFWVGLGAIYVGIGVIYLTGYSTKLGRHFGPALSRASTVKSAAGLGALFGLNIPACAAPLLFVLFGTATGATSRAQGFGTLALFGLALSLPLLLAVSFPAARRLLDRLAGLSQHAPFLTGGLLVALGTWSIGFAFFVDLANWA